MKIILQIIIQLLKIPIKTIKFIGTLIDFSFNLLGFLITVTMAFFFLFVTIYPHLSQSEKEEINIVLEKVYYGWNSVKEKGSKIIDSIANKIENISQYISDYINSRDIAERENIAFLRAYYKAFHCINKDPCKVLEETCGDSLSCIGNKVCNEMNSCIVCVSETKYVKQFFGVLDYEKLRDKSKKEIEEEIRKHLREVPVIKYYYYGVGARKISKNSYEIQICWKYGKIKRIVKGSVSLKELLTPLPVSPTDNLPF